MSKVYVITGTSSGFGQALAKSVLERGDKAVLTARNPASVADLVEKYPDNALAIRLDVTNAADRQALAPAVLKRFGRIDVLINNAGQGSLGAIEEFSSEQIRKQSGHILNITSIGGLVSLGGFALYCATKFAVEGFSEGLREEVKPLGIHVTIVEPGTFRTEFAGAANMSPEQSIDAYQPVVEPLRQYLYGNHGQQPGDPRKAALAMIQAVESDDPPLRLILGKDAYDLWAQKRAAEQDEINTWRAVGEDTAFPDATNRAIGG
jgi:NAD(P)-dependent dehydrogenase (short-subunit alcohol dehydrogenase family)